MEASHDFNDWELLQSNSDSDSAPLGSPNSALEEIDNSEGLIQADYFSLEADNRRFREELGDDKSAGSDNPSWIDPGLEENPARYANKEPCDFWSDSSSERSEDRRLADFHGIGELGFRRNEEKVLEFEGTGEEKGTRDRSEYRKFGELEGIGEVGFNRNEEKGLEFDGVGEIVEEKEVKVEALGSGVESCEVDLRAEMGSLGEEKSEGEKIGSGVVDVEEKRSDGIEKRGVVWWKMPMEFLRYCVLRMSPVWTISVAAAVMGFVILGRRLYKMKKKARGLEIKVTVDDKKVSQVMSRAARLNEAFSVVRRVPVIRPSLPTVGTTTTWPVMSLR